MRAVELIDCGGAGRVMEPRHAAVVRVVLRTVQPQAVVAWFPSLSWPCCGAGRLEKAADRLAAGCEAAGYGAAGGAVKQHCHVAAGSGAVVGAGGAAHRAAPCGKRS